MILGIKSIFQQARLNSRLKFNRTPFEQDCLLCATASGAHLLCAACYASLPCIAHACPSCAAPSADEICGECLKQPPAFDNAYAALEYAFPTDKLIQALKYGGQLALANLFGELLTDTLTAAARPQRILPMPLHPARLKQRGFNQAREIAKVIGKRLDIPLALDMAQRVVDTTPQATLPMDARHQNVKNAFACEHDLQGQHIAVVDDVMTSGATLDALAKVLKRAGAAQVDVWVVARATAHH